MCDPIRAKTSPGYHETSRLFLGVECGSATCVGRGRPLPSAAMAWPAPQGRDMQKLWGLIKSVAGYKVDPKRHTACTCMRLCIVCTHSAHLVHDL